MSSYCGKMKAYALSGQYMARDYQTVFYMIFRDGNILNLNPEKLCKSFEAVLRKIEKKQPYDPTMERYLAYSGEGEFADKFRRLKLIAIDINKGAAQMENQEKNRNLQNELSNNYEKLHHAMIGELNKPFGKASLSGINPRIFFHVFKTANNLQKHQMVTLYHIVYNNHHGNTEKADYDFATALEKLILQYLSKHPAKNASGNLILQLKTQVENHKKSIVHATGIS